MTLFSELGFWPINTSKATGITGIAFLNITILEWQIYVNYIFLVIGMKWWDIFLSNIK